MTTRTLLLLSALVSCVPKGPSYETSAYVIALHPLLQENSLLAEKVLETAAGVHADKLDGPGATEAWRSEILPIAEHLHQQAAIVHAPGPWVDAHVQLVEAWGTRAEAYALIAEGVERGDLQRWKRGRSMAVTAQLDEERWFQESNQRLTPKGISLDQFP